jgi:putative ABC transport system permease protein
VTSLTQDIRYALRTMLRSPGFTVVAVITLALGIGANTAIFSIVNGVLIRPLPYDRPDRLVSILESNPRRGLDVTAVSPANFLDWRRQSTAFSGMAGTQSLSFNFTGNTGAIRIDGAAISANLLSLLGQQPLRGRGFEEAEEQPGHDSVILISETLWQRQFGGDRDILGKIVTMNGQRFTIIGVLPASFQFPFPGLEVWKPLAFGNSDLANRSNYQLQVVARLKDGIHLNRPEQTCDP